MSTLITFVEPGMFTAVPAVITTRSPFSMIRCRRRPQRGRPQLLDVGALGDADRRHAPLERHVLKRVVVVGEPDDRPPRAQPRDRGRGAAGEGRHEDRPRLERLGDVARGVRHRLPDRRLLLRLRDLVPVAEARLDRAGDPVHVRDRLERELADRRLAGEHQRAACRRGSRSRRPMPRRASARARGSSTRASAWP